jgi:hypothetical protein
MFNAAHLCKSVDVSRQSGCSAGTLAASAVFHISQLRADNLLMTSVVLRRLFILCLTLSVFHLCQLHYPGVYAVPEPSNPLTGVLTSAE